MSYIKEEEENRLKEKVGPILSREFQDIKEFRDNAPDFKKKFAKAVKAKKFDSDSTDDKLSEIREKINSNILISIYSLSLSEINNLHDVINYKGYLCNDSAYLSSIENDDYLTVDDKNIVLSAFKDYFSIHNKMVLEERKKWDYTDLNIIKKYLLSVISDNKIYVQSMLSFENGKCEKLKSLSFLTEDQFVINGYKKNINDTNFDGSRNLKDYSSVQLIDRLYKFIKGTSSMEFYDIHYKIFMKLPFINEYDKNLFISYASYIEVTNEKLRRIKKAKESALRSIEKENNTLLIDPKESLDANNSIEEIDNYLEECFDIAEEFELENDPGEKNYLYRSIQIYNCIKSCDNSFDVVLKSLLPKIDQQQFYIILYEVLDMLQEDFDVFVECGYINEDFLEDKSSNVEHAENKISEDIDEELLHLFYAKEYLTNYIKEEEKIILENPLEVNETNGLFFAKKSLSNESYLKTDIKSLPKECDSEASELLNKAYYGYKTFDPRHQKKFSNHRLLKNIYEFKSQNLRLFYQHLGGNNYFFLGIFEKKVKNLNNIVINRSRYVNDQFSAIKQMIIDNNVPQDLISSNSLEFEQCVELVKEIEKGENGNGKVL